MTLCKGHVLDKVPALMTTASGTWYNTPAQLSSATALHPDGIGCGGGGVSDGSQSLGTPCPATPVQARVAESAGCPYNLRSVMSEHSN